MPSLISPLSIPCSPDALSALILCTSHAMSLAGTLSLDNLLRRSSCSSVSCVFNTFSGALAVECIGSRVEEALFESTTDGLGGSGARMADGCLFATVSSQESDAFKLDEVFAKATGSSRLVGSK